MNDNQKNLHLSVFGNIPENETVDLSPKDAFLSNWLSGSSCNSKKRNSIFYTSTCGNYLVLKHQGHTTYVDRIVGSSYCGTYYGLYDIRAQGPDRYGEPSLGRWAGRWNKKYYDEIKDIIKNR